MNTRKIKNILIRCFSIFLIIFSIAFGVTRNEDGYCLGDNILSGMGLKPWSNGTQGTHYTAVYALILLLAAFYLFAATTKK